MTNEIPLNDATRWILGRPNFWCGQIAHSLRRDGRDIPTKAEEEQAAVIHWLLSLYLKHGESFREEAYNELKRIESENKQCQQ